MHLFPQPAPGKSPRHFWKWTVFIVLSAVVLTSCERSPTPQAPPSDPSPQSKTERSATARTEQEWIVRSILRDIAELAVFSKDRAALPSDALELKSLPADAKGYHYIGRLRLPGQPEAVGVTVDVPGSIWDSAAYEPAARALLERINPAQKADAITVHETAVRTLTVPLAKNIQQENQRISTLLTGHPLSPEAHEQAALIVGVLGLRENSGVFWDTLGFCNRSTAHLAFARALRGGEARSDAGEIAELLTSLEADTKKDSEERIARLRQRNNPELAPWINAALMRNRRDWRVLEKRGTASLLERIEYFRAKCEAVSPDIAGEELLKSSPEKVSDWCNILLQFSFSVESGHRFTPPALGLLLQEVSDVFPESRPMKLTPENLAQVLNKDPGGPVQKDDSGAPRLMPIDSGMWAHFLQRHLVHAAAQTDVFLRERWCVPDQAAKFEDSVAQLFSKLTFAPLLQVVWCAPKHHNLASQAENLIRDHPEWVPDAPWAKLHRPSASRALGPWFSPGLPAGTAYRFASRREHLLSIKRLDADSLRKLHEIAPWQYNVSQCYVQALYGGKPSPEQARVILGPFLEFHHPAMERYAHLVKENVPEYSAIYERMAKLDPDQYMSLWEYYRERHLDEKAAESFQAAMDHEADAVWIANESAWMVNYCYDHGQKERALNIAKYAAEVYSHRGLEAMARLQERMGDMKEAESYFQKIQERYEDLSPLAAFYLRQTVRNPEYAAKLKKSIGSLFPNGLEPVGLENFTAAPQKGVKINGANSLLLNCGLKQGDIIVALDGKRVQNFPQYKLVRNLTDSSHMELIVYHEGAYKVVKTEVPNRMFGLEFISWP